MTAFCWPRSAVPRIARGAPLPPLPRPEAAFRRVGLLGGSFNPAHAGHRYISLEAIKRLGLDEVWWLVSPQNPLKRRNDMAPFAERLAQAREIARHRRIRVGDLECRLGTHYTVDTLRRLGAWPGHRFVWLIGADNLVQLPRWRAWRRILTACPVAVFERHPYAHAALAGAAASAFAAARLPDREVHRLVDATPPAWAFVRLRPHPESATRIRAGRHPKG